MYNTIVPTWPPTPVLSGYLSHNLVVTLTKHCSILLIMKTVFSYDFMINAKGWENVFDLIDDFNFIDAGNKSDSTRNLKRKKTFQNYFRRVLCYVFQHLRNVVQTLPVLLVYPDTRKQTKCFFFSKIHILIISFQRRRI